MRDEAAGVARASACASGAVLLHEMRAGRDGTVGEVHAREGHSVEAGALLLVIQ